MALSAAPPARSSLGTEGKASLLVFALLWDKVGGSPLPCFMLNFLDFLSLPTAIMWIYPQPWDGAGCAFSRATLTIWTSFQVASIPRQLICLYASPFGLWAPWGKAQSPFHDPGPAHNAKDTGRLLVSDGWRDQDLDWQAMCLRVLKTMGCGTQRVRGCSEQGRAMIDWT